MKRVVLASIFTVAGYAQQTCMNTEVAVTTAGVTQINGVTSYAFCLNPTNGKVAVNGSIPGGNSMMTPALSSFTWVNQGPAVTTQNVLNGPIQFRIGVDNTQNVRWMQTPQPATPYTLVSLLNFLPPSAGNRSRFGVFFTDGTKTLGLDYFGNGALMFQVESMTSTTEGTDTVPVVIATSMVGAPVNSLWLRLRNDGTNLNFDYSVDGSNWVNAFTDPVGTHLTPTALAFGGTNFIAAGATITGSVLSWVTSAGAGF